MNIKKFFLSLSITVLVLALAMIAYLLFVPMSDDFDNFLDTPESDKVNILVVGVDKDGVRSDVNMVVSVDPAEMTINLLSVPRDTKVTLGNKKTTKINSCIGRENGNELLIEKIKELTGLPIHHFCKLNFEAVRNIVDILGGVEFDVPIDMDYDDPYQDLHIHIKKGVQTLDGEDAEGLLRFRSGYANADLGRINTQQAFLKEMLKQKLSLKYLIKSPAIIGEVTKNLDTNMSGVYMLKYALKFRDGDKVSFNTYTLPGSSKTIGGASYYICNEAQTRELIENEFGFVDGSEISYYSSGDSENLSEKVIE